MDNESIAEDESRDVALMLRVREGDEEAFSELYLRNYRRLQDFFYGLSRDPEAAVDLCQETFIRIWKIRLKYAATGSFPAYLFSIARHIWLERCRAQKKLFRVGFFTRVEPHHESSAANEAYLPDAVAHHSDLQARLFEALDELPEEQRMAFVLRNLEGFSAAEAASVMRCPVNTVRSRKILAMKKLRRALKAYFYSTTD